MRERDLTLASLVLLSAAWLAALIGIPGPVIAYLWLAGLGITLTVTGILLANPQMGSKRLEALENINQSGSAPICPDDNKTAQGSEYEFWFLGRLYYP